MTTSMTSLARLIHRDAQAEQDRLVRIRRAIHAWPELGFEEERTASLVVEELAAAGLEPARIAGTGVVADLAGDHDGPTVLLRADMDALPIVERSSVPYRSRTRGRMHACGHDGHTAMLLSVARVLARRRAQLAGRVRFLFQPAEERPPGGALAVIEAGVLEGVDAALGLHLWVPLPLGSAAVASGPVMAAHDRLDVRIRGRGGHGAMPESARDPVVAAAHVVVALQTVVSRSVAPITPAVLSIGVIEAGNAFNVIPDVARLEGTIRTTDAHTRETVHQRIETLIRGTSRAHGVRATVTISPFVPALVNDPAVTAIVMAAASRVLGGSNVKSEFLTMGGEDFAFIAERVPATFIFLGAGSRDGRPTYPHHHPSFDFDERALVDGTHLMAIAAVDVLASWRRATVESEGSQG